MPTRTDLKRLASFEAFYNGDESAQLTQEGPTRKNEVRLVANYAQTIVRKHAYKVVDGMRSTIRQRTDAARDDETARRAQAVLDDIYRNSRARIEDRRAALMAAVDGDVWFRLKWSQVRGVTFAPVRKAFIDVTAWNDDYTEPLMIDFDDGRTKEHFDASASVYKFVPFVHLPNRPALNPPYGESDVPQLRALQRLYNERLSTLLWLMRVDGNPVVTAKGIDNVDNLRVGPGEIWEMKNAESEIDKVEFLSSQLISAHLEVVDQLKRIMLHLSDTPEILFGHSKGEGDVSGAEMEMKLEPYIAAIQSKREVWTFAVQRRNRLALQMHEIHNNVKFNGNIDTDVRFDEIVSARIAQRINDATKLVTTEIMSRKTAMSYTGVTQDPEAELKQIQAEKAQGFHVETGRSTVSVNSTGQPQTGGVRSGTR